MLFLILTTIAFICNAQSNFYKSFNVANEFEASNNTLNVRSTLNTNQDETLNISFSFTSGRCWNPMLSLTFEEIDFDNYDEYFLVYYPLSSDMIANCTGNFQQNCGYFSQCINDYNFNQKKYFEDGQVVTIYVTKSAKVNLFCDGYSMNLNVTIHCSYEEYHVWDTMSKDQLQTQLYGHITAYYNNTVTIIGGKTDPNTAAHHEIYTRTVTPYISANAIGNLLQFSNSWTENTVSTPTNVALFCEGQCYTQIGGILYIHSNGEESGTLLQHTLNDKSAVLNWTDNNANSALKLTHVCVTNNVSHIFIIGGYDGRSLSPYHNVQTYDIANDKWFPSFSTLIYPRTDSGCSVVNQRLYIIGGCTYYYGSDGSDATNIIEMLHLNTMVMTEISTVLDSARFGHRVLTDNQNRLWIIGGRSEDGLTIPDIELLDTSNNSMISTEKPIKYASTMTYADYSGPWYDNVQNLMFTSGGYDGVSVTNEIQYLWVHSLGVDAYPTPPPTPRPIPTPYPTPIGHYIGQNRTFDMQSYKATDSVSFTQVIQSEEDLKSESSFFYVDFKFINGMCSNASLSFKFEEVDYRTATTEYIDVFYPIYPDNEIAHCTGLNDFNCGTWIKCIDRMTLEQPLIDFRDNSYNYQISVEKSAEVNKWCNYTINANVTMHCGPRPPPTPLPTPSPTLNPTTMAPTSLYTNISRTFDMHWNVNDTVSFTIPVQSTVDNARDELFYVQFDFIMGQCENPRLTFLFEEIDFAATTEFIEIYYPSYPSNFLQRCDGTMDQNCGHFIECVSENILQTGPTDSLQFAILKSADVGQWCDYSINANVTITCGPVTGMPTPSPTDSANTNITQIFDLKGYTANDLVSFTIPVQSQIDNGYDSLFRIEFDFINGKCHNPTLQFDFEEIDFQQSYEFIEVYSPVYPNGFIKQCTGEMDYNCGINLNCIDTFPLYSISEIPNPANNITIYLLKSSEINKRCDYSINANVTISCGPQQPTKAPTLLPSLSPTPNPTTPVFAFGHTFDLSTMDPNKLINSYEINVNSGVDNGIDVIFNVTFTFTNGICYNPYLSVKFEEIDHASEDEYLEIRYPSDQMYDVIGRCDGDDDQKCNSFEQCMTYYDLGVHNISSINDEIVIYVLKSAEVNKLCTHSINANITISCISSANNNVHMSCPPTPDCTGSPTNNPTQTPTEKPFKTTTAPTNKPTERPSATTVDCGGLVNGDSDSKTDKLMDYLPWILAGTSGFFNVLLVIALIQQCRFRKSIEMRQRMALRNDSTQMVSMQTRAGHSDFQEIISDASVDYVTMVE